MRKLRLRKFKWPAWIWQRADPELKSRSLEAWCGAILPRQESVCKEIAQFRGTFPPRCGKYLCVYPLDDSRRRSLVSRYPQLLMSHLSWVLATSYPTVFVYFLAFWSALLVLWYVNHGLPYTPNFDFWINWRKWLENFGLKILSLTPIVSIPSYAYISKKISLD